MANCTRARVFVYTCRLSECCVIVYTRAHTIFTILYYLRCVTLTPYDLTVRTKEDCYKNCDRNTATNVTGRAETLLDNGNYYCSNDPRRGFAMRFEWCVRAKNKKSRRKNQSITVVANLLLRPTVTSNNSPNALTAYIV